MSYHRARARGALVAVLATVGAAAVPSAASAASSCSFDAGSAAVNISLTGFDTSTLARTAGGAITLNGTPCDAATVSNTETLHVVGDGSSQNLTLDFANGTFGPGLSPEPTGKSEIEMGIAMGGGLDKITLAGNNSANAFNIGTGGINYDGDDDRDINYSGVDNWVFKGLGGADNFSAAGSTADGSPITKAITLLGGSGSDTLRGGDAAFGDTIYGDADTESGTPASSPGKDTLIGDDGNDHLAGGPGDDHLDGGDGNDQLDLETGNDTYTGGSGNDRFANTVTGLTTGDGADSISGGPGTDNLDLSNRTHKLLVSEDNVANDGEDADLDGTAEEGDNVRSDVENIELGHGDDVLNLDTTSANAANVGNSITGGDGKDAITTGTGDDSVSGGTGNDTISTGDDDDSIDGGTQNDTIHGGNGTDAITGGTGVDKLYGDAGNDSFPQGFTPDQADKVTGGTGIDSVSYATSDDTLVTLDGVANDGADTDGDGTADEQDNIMPDVENVTTGSGNDVIDADFPAANAAASENSLSSSFGNDTLRGGDGGDSLSAGPGDDTLDGGEGEDSLQAGTGSDTIFAQDGFYDVLSGGGNDGGVDSWTADPYDDVSGLLGAG